MKIYPDLRYAQWRVLWGIITLIALSVLVACTDATTPENAEGDDADGGNVINLVQAPDPAWDWITDQGIRQEMEEEADIQILASNTWNYFSVYSGGHADVTQTSTYGVPLLQAETGVPTTVFGKWNTDRSMILVRADSEYQDNLCELEGETVAVNTPVETTLIWGAYAQEFCDGLDFRVGGGDFDLVVTDAQSLAPLVADGDAEACICLPDFAIPQLMSGELRGLYDGRSSSQFFQDEFLAGEPHDGPQNNLIIAPTEWVEANPDKAEFLLAVFERGLQEWSEHKEEIVAAYPQHFAATTAGEQEFIVDWIENRFTWFSDSAYLTDEWIENEQRVLDLMQRTGFMEEDMEPPTFEVIGSPS